MASAAVAPVGWMASLVAMVTVAAGAVASAASAALSSIVATGGAVASNATPEEADHNGDFASTPAKVDVVATTASPTTKVATGLPSTANAQRQNGMTTSGNLGAGQSADGPFECHWCCQNKVEA